MGKSRENREGTQRKAPSSSPFPSSPSSSSSSDFEFTVSLSPSSRRSPSQLCPADELFYKGQLLPLHLSPRISMVRTLLLASSSTSSSSTDTTTTASRDSNGSSSSSSSSVPSVDLFHLLPEYEDSSRPSSATEEEIKKAISSTPTKRNKYFTSFANRFSSVFLNRGGSKKDPPLGLDHDFGVVDPLPLPTSTSGKKTTNSSAKQVIRKYVNKVKPLYEKFSSSSQKNQNQNNQQQQQPQQQQKQKKKTFSFSIRRERDITLSNPNIVDSMKSLDDEEEGDDGGSTRGAYSISHSHSFSGNLRFPRIRKRCAGSCPSSMRSSPTHSGLLRIGGGGLGGFPGSSSSSSSSMEELQSAIQGAIAHCKSTMMQPNHKKALTSTVC